MVASSKAPSASRSRSRRAARSTGAQSRSSAIRSLVGVGVAAAERSLGLDELATDPLAKLLARHPAEGHDQHLVQGRDAFGDEASDQRGDGERLAGAGTGLQQGRPGRQRAADVEGVELAHRWPTRSAPSSRGCQSRQAYWPSRCGSEFQCSSSRGSVIRQSIGACVPKTRTCAGSASSPGIGASLNRGVSHRRVGLDAGLVVAGPISSRRTPRRTHKRSSPAIGSGSRMPRS